MKKILFLLVLLSCSTKIFADFALGVNAYGNWSDPSNIRNITEWGFGGDLAFGSMKGHPLILQVKGNSFSDTHAQVRANLDLHVLPVNLIGILQLFLGFGIGTAVNFNPAALLSDHDDWTRDLKILAYGRFPMGLKIFLSKLEIFLSVTPQLGWNIDPNSFYWSLEAGTGIRIWF